MRCLIPAHRIRCQRELIGRWHFPEIQNPGEIGFATPSASDHDSIAPCALKKTPGVAFAEPTDSGSTSSSSDSSSSTASSSSESAASTSSTGPTSSTNSPASAADSSSGSTSGIVQDSVDAQTSSTSSPSNASTADPRSGVVQSSGGAHTSSTPSSSDTTASAGATPSQTGVPSALATAAPAQPPAAALPNPAINHGVAHRAGRAGTLRGAGATTGFEYHVGDRLGRQHLPTGRAHRPG